MGVDYTGYLGLGRQIRISYTSFPYAEFNELEENGFLAETGFEFLMTSQEYKGTICACTFPLEMPVFACGKCTLFVGKLLHNQDLRDTTTLRVTATVEKINAADLSASERSKLDQVCESLVSKLGLDDEFGEYGISLLVRCW